MKDNTLLSKPDSGIIIPTLTLKSFLTYFGHQDAATRDAIVFVYQAGAWFGSASVGITSDRFGRHKAIAFGAIWGATGAALMADAAHVAMLIMGRLLVGFAVGTITGIAPVFGAEIAKTGVGEGKWDNANQWRVQEDPISSSALLSLSYMIIMILVAVYPAVVGQPTNVAAQHGLIACSFAVSANYSALLGPVIWIIPPEVFTTELRAKANALVQVIHYSIKSVITQLFFVAYPETKGKSLEEID
ncbi:sugar transporter-domain-containing protein [Hypoxylon sp. FL1150]|nr:sugar transporter-domain-containing protein [Hypoxylon sp. FL1150]